MRFSGRNKLLPFALAAILIGHALLSYGLPLPALIAIWLALCAWFYLAGPAPALLAAFSMALVTLLLNVLVGFSGLEGSIYYRPHERMKADNATSAAPSNQTRRQA
jgi:hypothetical protein